MIPDRLQITGQGKQVSAPRFRKRIGFLADRAVEFFFDQERRFDGVRGQNLEYWCCWR